MARTAEDSKKFGEDIAFGIQQTLACWATDFIDPYVGAKIQQKMEPDVGDEKELKHAWIGEIVGDTAALFVFLGVQRFIPQPVQWFKGIVKSLGDGFLEKSGRKSLELWSVKHNVAVDSPEYMKKLEEWKEFQADNLAKSSVVAIASTALNVWVQKSKMFATGFGKMTNQPEWEPNAHSWKAVAVSKISGAVITMATMMGLRFALPKTTKEWDEELSERYFTPLIRKTQKLFGAEVTPEQASPAETLEYSAASVKEPAPAVMSGEHEHRHSADKRHKHDDSHRARHESKKHHSRTGMVEKTREEAPHLGKA